MNPDNTNPPESAADSLHQAPVVARRLALVKALRAGGIAVGGGASLNAFASRVATSNGTQCTVSGQASAAVSRPANATNLPCAGFKPTSMCTADTTYTCNPASGYNVVVGSKKFKITNSFAAVQTNGVSGVRLAPANWPSLSVVTYPARATVKDIFGGSDATPLVYALYSNSDLGYFVAAYLSASLTIAPSGSTKLPFQASDVVKYYRNGALDANALSLYKLVCVA